MINSSPQKSSLRFCRLRHQLLPALHFLVVSVRAVAGESFAALPPAVAAGPVLEAVADARGEVAQAAVVAEVRLGGALDAGEPHDVFTIRVNVDRSRARSTVEIDEVACTSI